jgi:phage repressor protein C with HTH and peptisase S24 domain
VSARAFGKADNSAFQGIRRGSWPSVQKLQALAVALGLEFNFGLPTAAAKTQETVVLLGEEDFSAVPLFGAQASAGPGAENGEVEVIAQLAFQRDWLKKMNVKPDQACLLRVRGDSMSPQLQDGDVALIDQAKSKVRSGRVYAFVDIDGQTRIKRLDMLDDRTLLLRSDNPTHTWEVRKSAELNRIKMIGEVVWSGHSWKD